MIGRDGPEVGLPSGLSNSTGNASCRRWYRLSSVVRPYPALRWGHVPVTQALG